MRPALAALAALATGCLTLVPAADPAQDTFRFFEIESDFRAEPEEGVSGACGFPSMPEIDEADRTIRFHNDWPGRDYRALFLWATWHHGSCAVASTSWATSRQLAGRIDDEGPGGNATMEIRDGVLLVDGEEVPLGGNRTFTRSGVLGDGRAYTIATTIHDRGEWPRAGVSLA